MDTWNPAGSYLRIVLKDVQTEARVGLHPWEQFAARPTRLIVNVEMFVPLTTALDTPALDTPALDTPALDTVDPDTIVDYDQIRDALKLWPARPHTPLLETLLAELVTLCFANPRVAACRASVMKPDIFNEAAAAGVEVFMRREDYRPKGGA